MIRVSSHLATLCVFLLFACGSEELDTASTPVTTSCEISDYISKWRGDVVCDSSSVNFQGFEFSETSSGDLVFDYANVSNEGTYEITIDGCLFETVSTWRNSQGEEVANIVTGELKGDKIEATYSRTIGAFIQESCYGAAFEKYQ